MYKKFVFCKLNSFIHISIINYDLFIYNNYNLKKNKIINK